MFTVFRFIGNSSIGGWIGKNFLKLLVVIIVGFLLWWLYSFINTKFDKLDRLEVETAVQMQLIGKLTKELEQRRASDAITTQAVVTLKEQTVVVVQKAVATTVTVKKKIAEIEISNLPLEQKRTEKSIVFIRDLHEAYCATSEDACVEKTNEIKKEEVK